MVSSIHLGPGVSKCMCRAALRSITVFTIFHFTANTNGSGDFPIMIGQRKFGALSGSAARAITLLDLDASHSTCRFSGCSGIHNPVMLQLCNRTSRCGTAAASACLLACMITIRGRGGNPGIAVAVAGTAATAGRTTGCGSLCRNLIGLIVGNGLSVDLHAAYIVSDDNNGALRCVRDRKSTRLNSVT